LSFFRRFWLHLKAQTRRHFLTGLLVIVPLGLTFFVVSWIVRFMDQFLAFLPEKFHPDTYLPFSIPGLGVIFTLAIIQIVGMLSANLLGRRVVKTYEIVLDRIPFVRGIYLAVKQLLQQILSPNSDKFRRAVLVEYPRRGIYSIGFVTGIGSGVAQQKTPEKVLNVFIPTTPNPTSGYYLLIPESQAVSLDLTVEQAFKLIISAGIVGDTNQVPGGAGGEEAEDLFAGISPPPEG
jgi:uncharacterized membrane protein